MYGFVKAQLISVVMRAKLNMNVGVSSRVKYDIICRQNVVTLENVDIQTHTGLRFCVI